MEMKKKVKRRLARNKISKVRKRGGIDIKRKLTGKEVFFIVVLTFFISNFVLVVIYSFSSYDSIFSSPRIFNDRGGGISATRIYNVTVVGGVGVPGEVPFISYFDYSVRKLMGVQCIGDSCLGPEKFSNIKHLKNDYKYINFDMTLSPAGKPLFIFWDEQVEKIKYLRCADTLCSSIASESIVDQTPLSSTSFRKNVAITVTNDGFPLMFFREYGQVSHTSGSFITALKCHDLNCIRGSNTQTENGTFLNGSVDSAAAMIGSDGLPIYVFYQGNKLYAIHCNNNDCTSHSNKNLIQNTGSEQPGRKISMVVGPQGFPIIAYSDSAESYYSVCSNIDCSVSNSMVLKDPTNENNSIMHASVVIGIDNLPVIAVQKKTPSCITPWNCYDPSDIHFGLAVIHCNDLSCSSSEINWVDHRTGWIEPYYIYWFDHVGSYNSIKIGTDRNPTISYYDALNSQLMLAHCSSKKCVGSSHLEVLDSQGDVGKYTYLEYVKSAFGGNPPGKPTNPSTSVISSSEIDLSWTGSSGNPDGYYIYVSTNISGSPCPDTFKPIVIGNVNNFVVGDLESYTRYYFSVASYNEYGDSDCSSVVSGTTSAVNLSAPTGLDATKGTERYWIYLNWSSVVNALGYNVYISNTSNGPYIYLDSTDGIETYFYHNNNVYPSPEEHVVYYYKVSAINGPIEGPMSDWARGFLGGYPNAPTNLVANYPGATNMIVDLSWTGSAGIPLADSYAVYRSNQTIPATGYCNYCTVVNHNVTGTQYSDVLPGYPNNSNNRWYYRVAGRNSFGYGDKSNEVFITML